MSKISHICLFYNATYLLRLIFLLSYSRRKITTMRAQVSINAMWRFFLSLHRTDMKSIYTENWSGSKGLSNSR